MRDMVRVGQRAGEALSPFGAIIGLPHPEPCTTDATERQARPRVRESTDALPPDGWLDQPIYEVYYTLELE